MVGYNLIRGKWPDEPPKVHHLAAYIREVAKAEDRKILLRGHADEREKERIRPYNDLDLIRGLRIGDIEGEITSGTHPGDWKCKVVFPAREEKGTRNIGVILIVMDDGRLRLVTVEWED